MPLKYSCFFFLTCLLTYLLKKTWGRVISPDHKLRLSDCKADIFVSHTLQYSTRDVWRWSFDQLTKFNNNSWTVLKQRASKSIPIHYLLHKLTGNQQLTSNARRYATFLPDQQSGIHCQMICRIHLLTPSVCSGTWKHCYSLDTGVSEVSVFYIIMLYKLTFTYILTNLS